MDGSFSRQSISSIARRYPQISPGLTVRRSTRLKRKDDYFAQAVALNPRKRRKFSYQPLDKHQGQIRLFELLPGKKDEPLQGRLTTVNLEGCPQYDAVSYVWGDPQLRFRLVIDEDKILMALESLRKALIALRLEHESRMLWIDAICINQNDLQERGHQVRLMRAIYTTAQCVRIWLNVDVSLKSPAFRAMQRVGGPSTDWLFNGNPTSRKLRRPGRLRDHGAEFWDPLFEIFADPYWERVWTQQELFLARNIRFHFPHGVLLPDVLICFDQAVLHAHARLTQRGVLLKGKYSTRMFGKSLFSSMYTGFYAMRTGEAQQLHDAPVLLNLFLSSWSLKTTDSKDRVYGLVGLARDCSEIDIEPNYNLTRLEVYCLVIKHFIRKYKSLGFLCNFASDHDHSMPTWLPSPEKQSLLLHKQLRISKAAEIPVNLDSIILDNGVMSLRGIKCDIITARVDGFLCFIPILTWWRQLEVICVRLGLCNSSDKILANKAVLELLSFWSTDHEYHVLFNRPKPTFKELEQGILNLIGLPTRTGHTNLTIYDIACKMEFELSEEDLCIARSLRFTIQNSTLVGTYKNRLGLCHPSCSQCLAEPGDEVWVLFGCPMPMILRRHKMGRYLIIGPAVIPGLMMGEACKGLLSNGSPGPEYQGPEIEKIELV